MSADDTKTAPRRYHAAPHEHGEHGYYLADDPAIVRALAIAAVVDAVATLKEQEWYAFRRLCAACGPTTMAESNSSRSRRSRHQDTK